VIPARDASDRIYSGGGEISFTPLFLLLCLCSMFLFYSVLILLLVMDLLIENGGDE
jgi:hypothetical protein